MHRNSRSLFIIWVANVVFFSLWFQKVLAAHGAAKVSAYVTHGVFPKGSWERFTLKNGGNYLYSLNHIISSTSVFLLHIIFRKHGECFCQLLDHGFVPAHCQSHSK